MGGLIAPLLGGGGGGRASGRREHRRGRRLKSHRADPDHPGQPAQRADRQGHSDGLGHDRAAPQDPGSAGEPGRDSRRRRSRSMIPVYNTQAEEVANVVRQVYQDRLVTASGTGGGFNQPNPAQFIMALQAARGGRGRGAAAEARRAAAEEPVKMSIGVDARTNSLVVSAPDALVPGSQGAGRAARSRGDGFQSDARGRHAPAVQPGRRSPRPLGNARQLGAVRQHGEQLDTVDESRAVLPAGVRGDAGNVQSGRGRLSASEEECSRAEDFRAEDFRAEDFPGCRAFAAG